MPGALVDIVEERGTSSGVGHLAVVGGVYRAGPTAVTDGQAVDQLMDSSGRAVITVGTGAAGLGKAEDAAHVSADVGVFVLSVRNDANATRTDTDGDYSPVSTDLAGNSRTVGNVDHNAVDAGSPVKTGAKAVASATDTTAVAAGQRTNNVSDLLGRQIVSDSPATWTVVVTGAAAGAITTCTQAAVASRRHVVTHADVYIRAAAAVNDINVYLRDGATGAGTIKWQGVIGAGAPRGDSAGIAFPHGIELSVNTAATLDADAGGTSVIIVASLGGYTE